jgi:hypothetical protein
VSGDVGEGMIKDNNLIDGRYWALNDAGSYDLNQRTQGKYSLKEKGV